jgi:gas vesicle protein
MPADPRDVDKKVPTWDGDPDQWESYRDSVKWYNRKTPVEDRSGVAAHVAGNVTGKAWELVNRLSEQDQDKLADQGRDAVIMFFKDGLLENLVPEAGKHFREYVYKFRREKGESMKLYTARHTHQLNKLEKAMSGLTVTLWDTVRRRVQEYLDTLEEEDEPLNDSAKREESEKNSRKLQYSEGKSDKSARSDRSEGSSLSCKGNVLHEDLHLG